MMKIEKMFRKKIADIEVLMKHLNDLGEERAQTAQRSWTWLTLFYNLFAFLSYLKNWVMSKVGTNPPQNSPETHAQNNNMDSVRQGQTNYGTSGADDVGSGRRLIEERNERGRLKKQIDEAQKDAKTCELKMKAFEDQYGHFNVRALERECKEYQSEMERSARKGKMAKMDKGSEDKDRKKLIKILKECGEQMQAMFSIWHRFVPYMKKLSEHMEMAMTEMHNGQNDKLDNFMSMCQQLIAIGNCYCSITSTFISPSISNATLQFSSSDRSADAKDKLKAKITQMESDINHFIDNAGLKFRTNIAAAIDEK